MKMPQWLQDLIDIYKKPPKPIPGKPTPPPPGKQVIDLGRFESEVSSRNDGTQWFKLPGVPKTAAVTVDGHKSRYEYGKGQHLWFINVNKVAAGKVRAECPDVVYIGLINNYQGSATPDPSPPDHIGITSVKRCPPVDHYSPQGFHGKASAVVLCPRYRASSVDINGVNLKPHSDDEGRQCMARWGKPGLTGTMTIKLRDGRIFKCRVTRRKEYGPCRPEKH